MKSLFLSIFLMSVFIGKFAGACSFDKKDIPPPLGLAEINLGLLSSGNILSGTNGIPSVNTLLGIGDSFAFGPEAQYLSDRVMGEHWYLGFRATYFFNQRRFTTGFILSLVNQEGQTINHVSEDGDLITHGANQFTHTSLLFGYEWASRPLYKSIRFNAVGTAGLGYTHNTNCGVDGYCGFGGGPDSMVAWSGEGFFPEVSIRAGFSF